jgi:hypothetical protein
MSLRPIPPPFPFPEQWERVSQKQRSAGLVKWLVPGCEIPLVQTIHERGVDSNGHETRSQDSTTDLLALRETGEDGYIDETITLSDIWAARFSKTIKRMKQKVHKAKRKATWTKNR